MRGPRGHHWQSGVPRRSRASMEALVQVSPRGRLGTGGQEVGSGCPCLSEGLGRRGAGVQRGAGRGQARPPWGNDHPWDQPCAHRGVSRYLGNAKP